MLNIFRSASDLFWDERLWFPPGVNWTTLKSTQYEQYPEFSDMYLPIGYAFLMLIFRFIFEWTIARPFGMWLGINDTDSELPHLFKRFYWRLKALTGSQAIIDGQSVQRRVRTKSGRFRPIFIPKSTLDKFCEGCFRFFFYFSIFWYGLYALWDKPWFWDQASCWYGYPFQPVDSDIKLYYILEASFYWSLTISQFTDVQRKDFEMFMIHHIATISLIWFSWADNFVRVGSLVLIVHDASDFWMEAAKLAKYAEYNQLCNVLSAIFSLSWFVTRCGIYPLKIIYSTLIEAPALIPWFPAYYVFNSLLLVLQVLHIIWSVMLVKVLIATFSSGVINDVRSDDEEDESDSDEKSKSNQKSKQN